MAFWTKIRSWARALWSKICNHMGQALGKQNSLRKNPRKLIKATVTYLRSLFSWTNIKSGFMKSLRWTFFSTLALIALLTLLLSIATFVIDEEDINRNISKWVRDSTGADFHVEATDINLLTGITFNKIKLYPKDLNKWPNQEPIVSLDQLALHYDLLRILLFEVKLKRAQLIGPTIFLRQEDGQWNYQPILNFLAQHNSANEPDQMTDSDVAKSEDASNTLAIGSILPVHPATILILPFKLNIANIGFTDLQVSIHQQSLTGEGIPIEQETIFSGLSVNTSLYWAGTSSKIQFKVSQTENRPIELHVRETDSELGNLALKLMASLNLNQSITLEDFDKLQIAADVALKELRMDDIKLNDQPIHIDIVIRLLESLDGVNIEKAMIELVKVISFKSSGNISFLDGLLNQFQLNLNQKLDVNLSQAGKLLSQLKIPIKTAGTLAIDPLKIEGPLVPSQISAKLPKGSLPETMLNLNFNDIQVDAQEAKIQLEPTTGNIRIVANSQVAEDGLQLELDSDIRGKGLKIEQNVNSNNASIKLDHIQNNISARLTYPNIVIPFFRVALDIDKMNARVGKESPINIPFSFELYGSVSKEWQKINLDSKLDIENLLDFAIDLRCKNKCNKFRLNQSLKLGSFANLYTFVHPVLSKTLPLETIPEFVEGKLSLRTNIKGVSKNIQETNLQKVLASTKGQLGLDLNLEGFSTALPMQDFRISDFNTKIGLDGSFQKQVLELKQSFAKLSFLLDKPIKQEDKPKSLSLHHYSFDTKINNESRLKDGIKNITDKVSTQLQSRLYLGQVIAEGIIPKPINSIGVELDLKQAKLKKLQLKKLELQAPDFGARVNLQGDAFIGKYHLPEAFNFLTNINIKHSGGEGIASGVKTAGSMQLSSAVSSKDMKLLNIYGKSSFDSFFLSLPNPKDSDKPLVRIEDINGDFPLRQQVDISPFFDIENLRKKHIQKSEISNKSPTPPKEESNVLNNSIKENTQPASDQEETKNSQENLANTVTLNKNTLDPIDAYYKKTSQNLSADTNLVGHVDFLTVKDFYPETRTLSIKKIEAANLKFNNLEFDIDVKQNWLSLSQFTIGFLGGKIQGDLRLAFSPMPDRLKMSVHLTQLDSTKLIENFPDLKKKTQSWDLFSDPYIDSNLHLYYDLRNNDMSGGVDITKIGKEQLKMMLFYLDPKGKNPSLDSIKTALNFGDVSHVTVPIKNGFIGLDVGVTVLAIPLPLPKLDQFPVAELISNLQQSKAPIKKENDEKTTM